MAGYTKILHTKKLWQTISLSPSFLLSYTHSHTWTTLVQFIMIYHSVKCEGEGETIHIWFRTRQGLTKLGSLIERFHTQLSRTCSYSQICATFFKKVILKVYYTYQKLELVLQYNGPLNNLVSNLATFSGILLHLWAFFRLVGVVGRIRKEDRENSQFG